MGIVSFGDAGYGMILFIPVLCGVLLNLEFLLGWLFSPMFVCRPMFHQVCYYCHRISISAQAALRMFRSFLEPLLYLVLLM